MTTELVTKGQPRSTVRTVRGIAATVGSVMSAVRAVSQLRSARDEGDRLLFANALANAAVFVTATLLAVRDLRKARAK